MPDDADAPGGDDAADDGDTPANGGADDRIDDATVVETAAEAAKDVVFSRYDNSELQDLDVTVSFEDGVLEVDVYVDADGAGDPERVADDAALAAQGAVDDLLE